MTTSDKAANRDAVIVAVTGASGAGYAVRLIERLTKQMVPVHLLLSDAARVVFRQELDLTLDKQPKAVAEQLTDLIQADRSLIHCYALDDWFSPVASGSAGIRQMVILPCSMGTLGRIAAGISENLIERAADVMIKEQRQLIIAPRETPLSSIHLENMLKLSRNGVTIMPAMPAFYHRPTEISELFDFLVDRILDHLKIDNPEAKKWGCA